MRTSAHIAATFGRVLREQRGTRRLSQEGLALSAGVDRTFVSQMERGIRQPTLTTIWKLAAALDVSPATLVARVDRLRRGERHGRDDRRGRGERLRR